MENIILQTRYGLEFLHTLGRIQRQASRPDKSFTGRLTDMVDAANLPNCYDPFMSEYASVLSGKAALAAQAWVEVSELLDLQLSPLGIRAIDALAPAPGDMVVDIGCGAGQSTLQLAGRVGATGRVVGVDIAAPLLELARCRAASLPHVSFLQADAQCVDLGCGTADGIYSRFGVMAFADPQKAFERFRRILKPSGRLAFVCWRSLDANELDLMPLQATGLTRLIQRHGRDSVAGVA